MAGPPGIESFVRHAALKRLETYHIWPENIFQLELEGAGVYQDLSGPALRGLAREGLIERRTDPNDPFAFPYFADPGNLPSTREIETIREKAERFMSFLSDTANSGFFAELVNYVALCRVILELQEQGVMIDVFPKGAYAGLIGTSWESDAMILIGNEYFPLDVYNGTQFISPGHEKVLHAQEISRPRSNPILICRLSATKTKRIYLKINGLVLDLGTILALDAPGSEEFMVAARDFNVHRLITPIKPIAVAGNVLDGDTYDDLVRKEVGGWRVLKQSDFAEAAKQIPEVLIRRARGFLKLLYVNTGYRRATTFEDKAAALGVQEAFHDLLRHPEGMDMDEFVRNAWAGLASFRPGGRAIDGDRRNKVSAGIVLRISDLETNGVVRLRDARIAVVESEHPFITLTFGGRTD